MGYGIGIFYHVGGIREWFSLISETESDGSSSNLLIQHASKVLEFSSQYNSSGWEHPPRQGLPYIPRVHLSEGSLVRNPLKWLWSEEPIVRRSFIPKFVFSESCYVPKIPYSERPSTIWILCYEDSLVRSSSSPKGAMFRTSIFRKSPLPHTGSILRRSFSPKFPQF